MRQRTTQQRQRMIVRRREHVEFGDIESSVVLRQARDVIRARFDTQFTTDETARHFGLMDAMSVDASASWMVRRTLRMKNRYEYHNNSYYSGIADTVGDYVIGTGPRLQMTIAGKPQLNKRIEDLFSAWSDEIELSDTLKVGRVARIYNGEAVNLLRTNPTLDSPVKLDVFQIEADQLSSPMFNMMPAKYPDQYFDGVILNPWGRPDRYQILRQHPGSFGAFVILAYEWDDWPAKYVIHDFKRVRPGQQRGIPEANPALPLFALLRQYTLACVNAAELVAKFAMVAETTAPPDPDGTFSTPMTKADLERGMMTFLPEGYHLNQIKSEQPTTTYEVFCNALLREISRCLQLPLMFASLDATQANMSSAYVVTQPFVKSVQKDRARYNRHLNRILDMWLTEAIRIPGLLPEIPNEFPHVWRWPRIGTHADPLKVASAHDLSLKNGSTSLDDICAEEGTDPDEVESNNARRLNMTVDEYRDAMRERTFPPTPAPAAPGGNDKPTDPDDESDDDKE